MKHMVSNLRIIMFATLFVAFAGLFSSVPQVSYAAGNCDGSQLEASIDQYGVRNELPQLPKYCSTGAVTRKVLNVAFALIGGVTVLFIVIGGYQYMTSGGSEEQAKKGKTTAMWAIIGLSVVLLATAIVNILVNLLVKGTSF